MDVSLFFAGTAGSVPTARRGLPALLLRAGGERILIDCGEGTQQQLLRSVGLPDVGAVFITHFHLDHWLGLPGMIKSFDLRARERPLTVYGPPGLQRGETVDGVMPEQVMGETRPGRRIVISGDTAPCQAVEVFAHGADVLVHEATFMEDERARARETAHSTARQAAEIARDAGVGLLALTHLSTRYFPRELRDEARATFPNTVVPRDFDEIAVPFPERGEPALAKAEREPDPEPAAAP